MKTGVIVLGQHSASAGERSVADRCAEFLKERGRMNVNVAYHYGEPSSDSVMERMNREGVDTFVILPLAVSEGRMTVWEMPRRIGLPDNCGSWRIMNGRDVATRFATALGRNHALAEELVRREGPAEDDTALLLLSYGSENPECPRTAGFYAGELERNGWMTGVAYCHHGTTVEEAVTDLRGRGAKRVRVIPLFVSFDGPSASSAKRRLESSGMDIEYGDPISDLESFYMILDSKVPEGW